MHSARSKTYGPTQKEIADALELAQSTVATALNPDTAHKLQPETAARIHAYAQKVGYRPQRFAQIMRSGRSHTIGAVFVSGIYHAPQERVKLLARHALEGGFNLIAVDLDWFGRDHRTAQHYLLDAAVEGVVLCNLSEELATNWAAFCSKKALPLVAMSGMLAVAGVDRVQSDVENAFYAMTRHHLDQGSRKLDLLLFVPNASTMGVLNAGHSASSRAQGFIRAVVEAGGVVEADATGRRLFGLNSMKQRVSKATIRARIHYAVDDVAILNSFEHGCLWMRRILEMGEVPDSLICANDNIATGALSVCMETGIRVPHELRVSGMDDAPFSRYCGVPLTTIRQPSEDMAEWAVQRIIELIERRSQPANNQVKHRVLACDIVLRNSTMRQTVPGSVKARGKKAEINAI